MGTGSFSYPDFYPDESLEQCGLRGLALPGCVPVFSGGLPLAGLGAALDCSAPSAAPVVIGGCLQPDVRLAWLGLFHDLSSVHFA